jgi:hypothetical protein
MPPSSFDVGTPKLLVDFANISHTPTSGMWILNSSYMITMQINYEIKLYADYTHRFVKHHILRSVTPTSKFGSTTQKPYSSDPSIKKLMNLCTRYLSILFLFSGQQMNIPMRLQ